MTIYISSLGDRHRRLFLELVRSVLLLVDHDHTARPDDVTWISQTDSRRRLASLFEAGEVSQLSRSDAVVCLEVLHRIQYSLGPHDLQTITGHSLREFASIGLILASEVYGGINSDTLWTDVDNP